jgi:hypothetical protein
MYWMTQPVSSPPPPIDNSVDVAIAEVASVGGIAMSAVALLILVRRWMRVRAILTEAAHPAR